ncbi:MAG TPA: hypothetical protein VMY35_00820 [Phycisphaerae bacterium]|nr:hypothetical protein [Phycisphaerae bacterium]
MQKVFFQKWGLTPFFVLALAVVAQGADAAPPFDLAADLVLTHGWARQGAYVPVRLRVTNRTDRTFDRVLVDSGGAVRVAAPWRIAPGETAEKTLPVYFAGGDLLLEITFATAKGTVGPVRAVADVRPLDRETRLFAFVADPAMPARVSENRILIPLDAGDLATVARCGVLDGVLYEGSAPPPVASPRPLTVLRLGDDGEEIIVRRAFPPGAGEPVQPAVHDCFASNLWPALDRRRLWLGLGLAALAVLALGLLVPARRTVLAAGTMVALAAAATAAILLFGGIRESRILEARVVYADPWAGVAAVERFVRLESRGASAARLSLRLEDGLPLPVLASSGDLFRPALGLDLGDPPHVESRTSGAVVGFLERAPGGLAAEIGEGPDVVASLVVDGTTARAPDDPSTMPFDGLRAPSEVEGLGVALSKSKGEEASRPVLAWAAEWRASADANLAHAGRTLGWWAAERQTGAGPFLVVWRREPPSPEGVERLPTMLVFEVSIALARAPN